MINKIQLYILIWWWCECGIPYFYLFVQWTQCWMYCSVRRVHIQYIHIRIHTLTLHIHIQILTLTFMHMNLHTHTHYTNHSYFFERMFLCVTLLALASSQQFLRFTILQYTLLYISVWLITTQRNQLSYYRINRIPNIEREWFTRIIHKLYANLS